MTNDKPESTMKLTSPFRYFAAAVLCGVLSLSIPARGADDKVAGATAPITKGQRVFTCGHSFHVFVYKLLEEVAKSAKIADHQSVGLSSIGGSRVIQHWEAPEQSRSSLRARKALRAPARRRNSVRRLRASAAARETTIKPAPRPRDCNR